MGIKKHMNQVTVGNAYNSENYYYPIPGNNKVARYFTTGEKLSLACHMISKGEYAPEHIHMHEQALLIPQGDGAVIINGKEYKASPGFFAIIPPNVPHTYSAKNASQLSWNMDIFTPARLEYDRDLFCQLLIDGKDPAKINITE